MTQFLCNKAWMSSFIAISLQQGMDVLVHFLQQGMDVLVHFNNTGMASFYLAIPDISLTPV